MAAPFSRPGANEAKLEFGGTDPGYGSEVDVWGWGLGLAGPKTLNPKPYKPYKP